MTKCSLIHSYIHSFTNPSIQLMLAIGIPFYLLLGATQENRDDVCNVGREKVILPFSFLGKCYIKKLWWWEVIVFMKKLFLCAAFNLSSYGSFHSMVFVLLILTISLFLQLVFRPYRRNIDTMLEIASLFMLLLIVSVGVTGLLSNTNLTLLTTLPLVGLNLLVLFVLSVVIVFDKQKLLLYIQKRILRVFKIERDGYDLKNPVVAAVRMTPVIELRKSFLKKQQERELDNKNIIVSQRNPIHIAKVRGDSAGERGCGGHCESII
jgi:hypothetical protein